MPCELNVHWRQFSVPAARVSQVRKVAPFSGWLAFVRVMYSASMPQWFAWDDSRQATEWQYRSIPSCRSS